VQLNLQHSLRTHLASVMDVQVVWIYDGVKLPDEAAKPFMTIEQMQNNNAVLSKGREAVETIHRFQIGLFAKSASERATLQATVKRHLLFDKIPLIDLTQSPAVVSGFFHTDLTGEVPIGADSTDARNTYHRVYFDVEVPTVTHRN